MMKKWNLGTCLCTALAGVGFVLAVASEASAGIRACCLPDGTCADLSAQTCGDQGGTAQPANTSCANDGCPDCDCDGDSDAKEIADCIQNCIDGGGNPGPCNSACQSNDVPKNCGDAESNCDDSDPCTLDSCNALNGQCINVERDCDDGVDCTLDVCKDDPLLQCENSGAACESNDDCEGAHNVCEFNLNACDSDADCNNTVNEECITIPAEECVSIQDWQCVNKPINNRCDDDDLCTVDLCFPLVGGDPTKQFDVTCGTAIPDGGTDANPGRCEVNVPAAGSVFDLDVAVNISHTWSSDLVVTVINKTSGVQSVLMNRTCGSADDIDATFDDDVPTNPGTCGPLTGTIRPIDAFGTPLSAFDGTPKAGMWSLNVADFVGFDSGVINNYSLIFNNFPGGCSNGPEPAIDDGVDCTNDSCEPSTGVITHSANDTKCDDSDDCTTDTCDPVDDCQNVFNDKDGDGTCDVDDECPNDPKQSEEGICGCFNSATDKDGDGVVDCLDDCPNDEKCSDLSACDCVDIRSRVIVLSEPSGKNTAGSDQDLPVEDTVHLQNGCFVVEVWAQSTRGEFVSGSEETGNGFVDKTALACWYGDLAWGDGCIFKVTDIDFNDETFPQFQKGTIDNNNLVIDDLGACTLDAGVGIHPRWHRIATVAVEAAHPKCKNVVATTRDDETKVPSFYGGGDHPTSKNTQDDDSGVSIECLGSIYNLNGQGDTGQGQITTGDFSHFVPCWMASADGDCAAVDWDCDGIIGPGDLNLFASAWQKDVCGVEIDVHPCQLHCDGAASDYVHHWASEELIRSFGLPVPPRDWDGWKLDPARQVEKQDSGRQTGRRVQR